MKSVELNIRINNPTRLIRELSSDETLGQHNPGLSTFKEKTIFHFDDTFDSADETYLRFTFIDNFTDENNENDFTPKILSMKNSRIQERDFREINYKTELSQSLFPKRTSIQGEIQRVEWYSDEDMTNKVLDVAITYERDPFGLATSRSTVRKWVMNNDQYHEDIKTTKKRYNINLEDQIVEGKRRRGNIVNSIQLPTMAFMVESMTVAPYNLSPTAILLMGRDFLDRHETEFSKFIDSSSSVTDFTDPNFGKKNVVIAIEQAALSTDQWLKETPGQLGGATIEQYLIGQFTI